MNNSNGEVEIQLGHPMLLVRKLALFMILAGCFVAGVGWFMALGMNQYAWMSAIKIGQWIAIPGAALLGLFYLGRIFGFSPKAS